MALRAGRTFAIIVAKIGIAVPNKDLFALLPATVVATLCLVRYLQQPRVTR